jgi:hypothetical protein
MSLNRLSQNWGPVQFAGRILPAKMSDTAWLLAFRNGRVNILPGDALRAIVSTTVKYGFDAEVIGSQYEIVRVLEVIPGERPSQSNMPFS